MLKKIFSHTLACICLLTAMQGMAKPGKPAPPSAARLISQQQTSPLLFTENRGQVTDKAGKARPDILFTAQNGNTSLFLKATGLYYQFTKISYPAGYDPSNTDFANSTKQAEPGKQIVTQTYNFSLTLEGANPHPEILRQDKSITEQNFYLPQCPNGITHVAGYQKLVYEEVYPHIDWIVYSNGSHLKYDFLVKPGGDPSRIKLNIKDAEGVSITKDGGLLMKTSLGEVNEKAPVSYAGGQQVKSSFRRNDDGTIGFDVAAQQGKNLLIDPAVVWNTYFGGTGTEFNSGCVVDGSGNVYISGYTSSSAAIASGGLQTTIGGGQDAYLAKYNTSGYLLWSTYYGGTGTDQGIACALDPTGNVYMNGATNSATVIASGGFQNTIAGGIDLFLVKFNASGSRIWSTYYGGTGSESTTASVCTDASGNVYMAGSTPSATGIASGGFQNTSGGGSDGLLVKFNATGSRLWATYYGGSGSDASQACTTDGSGNVYMTGNTSSSAGIAAGGFQNAFSGGTNAYLVKFDAAGNRLWGTYYGGTSAGDVGYACITDASGNVYMAGGTTSTAGIASSGFQNTFGGGTGTDGFLVKFDATGNRLWGTYYGGNNADVILGCALDAAGNIYLTGSASSATGIASSGFQNTLSTPNDAFITEVSPSGSLLWGSYYGSTGNEQGRNCAVDALGNVFVAGYTLSTSGLVIPGTFQSTIGGGQDAFLLKVGTPALFTDTAIATTPMCAGAALNVPFTLFGTYNAGNIFTAQLSNASGSFASPVDIGTTTGTASGTINATILASTLAGTGYRIRVISSNPVMIAPNNGKNLSVTICCVRTTSTITQTICSNALPYTWRGDVITAGGLAVADDTLVNAGGCDSVITLNLTVNPTTSGIENKSYCTNQLPQTWHGTTIPVGATSNAAYATFTTTNAAGCDSVITLNLMIKQPTTATESKSYCANQLPQTWHGTTIPAGATSNAAYATFTTTNAAGCDSVITLNLSIKQPTASTESKTYCSNQLPQTWHSTVIPVGAASNASYATYTTTNAAGCDSVITLNLTIKQRTTSIDSKTYCSNQLPQIWHSTTIPVGATSSASYATFTITNAAGCDSIITLNLTIKQATTSVEAKTYCANQLPQTWHGTTIPVGATSNAAYATFTTTNAAGCDSVITLNLTVTPAVIPSITINAVPGNAICTGTAVTFTATPVNGGSTPVYQWRKNGITVGTAGTYTSNILNDQDTILCIMGSSAGCVTNPIDTSNVIIMTVNGMVPPTVTITANPGISVSSGTLVTFTAIVLNGGTTPLYEWKKNNTVVSTNTTYATSTLVNNDVITCVVTGNNSCAIANVDTSNPLVMHISTGIGHTGSVLQDLKLYPNPNNGFFTVEATVAAGDGSASIEVLNAVGQLVYQQKVDVLNSKLSTQINLPEGVTAKGVYLLRIRTDEGIDVMRFLLTR